MRPFVGRRGQRQRSQSARPDMLAFRDPAFGRAVGRGRLLGVAIWKRCQMFAANCSYRYEKLRVAGRSERAGYDSSLAGRDSLP
jgi:hypothetical protein